jgi:hypothetical protein
VDTATNLSFTQDYKCLKGHRVALTWRAADVLAAYLNGGVHLYCILCDESRPASRSELAAIFTALELRPPVPR